MHLINQCKVSRQSCGPIIALILLASAPVRAKVAGPPSNEGLEIARKLEGAFINVADQTSRSVVVITSTHKIGGKNAAPDGENEGAPFGQSPFDFFFRHDGVPPVPQPRDIDAEGSGIIYREDGYILTNNHVVDQADSLKVRLQDGREYSAKVVGTDERTDIAVIKVDAKGLPAARLGDSDAVKVGQWAIAIGAPYELEYSFTVGFVSAKGRSAVTGRGGSAYEDYLQTDAAINPGNSGGPLCDIEGRVIGMNTLIRGLNRGIGFAIPVNMAREIADQLIAKGKIVRPWLGISIEALSENKELQELQKNVKEGVIVREIRPNTPAAASELKPADIIVAVDGVAVKSPRDLQRQILRKHVGQPVALDVVRDGKPIRVALQTAEMADEVVTASRRTPTRAEAESAFGMTVRTLTKDLAKQLGVKEVEGVVVIDVEEGSLAEKKGLQRGDIITEVKRSPIRNVTEFKAVMKSVDPKEGVVLYYQRDGAAQFVVLKETQ